MGQLKKSEKKKRSKLSQKLGVGATAIPAPLLDKVSRAGKQKQLARRAEGSDESSSSSSSSEAEDGEEALKKKMQKHKVQNLRKKKKKKKTRTNPHFFFFFFFFAFFFFVILPGGTCCPEEARPRVPCVSREEQRGSPCLWPRVPERRRDGL